MELNNSYITCAFVEGSDALGCETVSTCNTSVSGKAVTSKVTAQIKLDPNLSYATGGIVSVEISDCLTYNIYVYEVLPDGSTGANAVKTFSNITIVPRPLPTSNYDELPTPSQSSSTTAPTENPKGIIINACMYKVNIVVHV